MVTARDQIKARDRIQLPLQFDPGRLRQDLEHLQLRPFIYYDVMPLRSPAHLVDPTLAPPPKTGDYANGTWTDWLDTGALRKSPYLTSLVDTFREHCRVTLVRLCRLAPEAEVAEHTDPTLGLHIDRTVVRLTIPITGADNSVFFLNGEPVPMGPGECWYLRLTDPHRVTNPGATERVNLTIDLEANDWLYGMLGADRAA